MYDFFFNTKIGYFILLFLSSELLNAIVFSALAYLTTMEFVNLFIGGTIGSLVMSAYYAATKN